MPDQRSFQIVLRAYVDRSLYSVGQLSSLSGVPPETIKNWLEGRVQRPRDWRAIASVARALHLTRSEVSTLLHAGSQPALDRLIGSALSEEERGVLAPWVPSGPVAPDPAILAVAHDRLAELPVSIIPEPDSLPPGSRMPLRRNPTFVGRQTQMVALARALKGGAITSIGGGQIAALTGLGGIGKTQLAVEFVHRYGTYFAGGVFWLSFADPKGVPGEIAACGGAGCMELRQGFGALPLHEQVQLVLAAWQSPLPRLLVCDNCEDDELLAQWCPTTGGSRVLVTSRHMDWEVTLGVRVLPVNVLPRHDSIALLSTYLPRAPAAHAALDAIAAEVGDLPLALHLVGTFLARYRHTISPTDYLHELQKSPLLEHPSFQTTGISPTRHVQDVERTFGLSVDRLNRADPTDLLTLSLLAVAAHCAPGELIPLNFLVSVLDDLVPHLKPAMHIEHALSRAVDLGVIGRENSGMLRMHRLVALSVRTQAAIHDASGAIERILIQHAATANLNADILSLRALQTHFRHVTQQALPREDEQVAALCHALGYHLWLDGNMSDAREYLEQAVRMGRAQGDDLRLADSLEILGLLLQNLGDLHQPRVFHEQTLRIRERMIGPDHPDTIDAHDNLGYAMLLRGEYPEAQAHLMHVLRMRRRRFGLRHAATARSLNNLGLVYYETGVYWKARRHLQLALALRECLFPEPHLAVAQAWNNFGMVLHVLGDYKHARCCHERSLTMRRQLFDDNHHDIAESLHNLGRTAQAVGKYGDARTYCDQALSIALAQIGEETRETANILVTLGSVLLDQGHVDDAQRALEKALAIHLRVVGDRHRDTYTSMDKLGQVLAARGELEHARTYAVRALALRKDALGTMHPEVADSLQHVGTISESIGDTREARRCYEEAMTITSHHFGAEDNRTVVLKTQLDCLNGESLAPSSIRPCAGFQAHPIRFSDA